MRNLAQQGDQELGFWSRNRTVAMLSQCWVLTTFVALQIYTASLVPLFYSVGPTQPFRDLDDLGIAH